MVVTSLGGCSSESSTHFELSEAELASSDPVVQAEVALKQFFNAVADGDEALVAALVVEDRRGFGWEVSRLEVESITIEPDYAEEGEGGRCLAFRAPVRMWPGDESVGAGELLNWVWLVEQGADGKWRIKDWGY